MLESNPTSSNAEESKPSAPKKQPRKTDNSVKVNSIIEKKRSAKFALFGNALTNMVTMYKNGQNGQPTTENVAEKKAPEIDQQASQVEERTDEPEVNVSKHKKKAEAVSSGHKKKARKQRHENKGRQEQQVQEEPRSQLPDNLERNTEDQTMVGMD